MLSVCFTIAFDTAAFVHILSLLLPKFALVRLSLNSPPDFLLPMPSTHFSPHKQPQPSLLTFFSTCFCPLCYHTSHFPSSCQASFLSKFELMCAVTKYVYILSTSRWFISDHMVNKKSNSFFILKV